MSKLVEQLEQQLTAHNLDLNDWRLLVQRLLDYGVLCRDDSQVEAEFYDQFVRVQSLVDEYFSLMGVRFQHDPHFQFVRIIPPGARVPGLEDETDEPFNGGFRQRLSQNEIALILVLRAEYDKSLREGLIDEQGCTTLSLEAVALAMKNLLRRALPENIGERRQLFKRLRQLRLIHYIQEADLDQAENWIKIRPLIINLVTNEWLDKIRTDLAAHSALMDEDKTEQDDTTPTSQTADFAEKSPDNSPKQTKKTEAQKSKTTVKKSGSSEGAGKKIDKSKKGSTESNKKSTTKESSKEKPDSHSLFSDNH